MKNLLLIIVLLGLITISSCLKPPTTPPAPEEIIVNVTTREGFRTTIMPGIIKSSLVPGFEHQYDTCTLTVTIHNELNEQFFFKNPTEPIYNNLALSDVGIYSFYVSTTTDPDTISAVKSMIAFSTPDSIRAGVTDIELDEEVKQCLVLVDANTVDGIPTIYVGNTVGLMSRYENFYYAYVLAPCVVEFAQGGIPGQRAIPFQKGTIYAYAPYMINIRTKDGFTRVVYL